MAPKRKNKATENPHRMSNFKGSCPKKMDEVLESFDKKSNSVLVGKHDTIRVQRKGKKVNYYTGKLMELVRSFKPTQHTHILCPIDWINEDDVANNHSSLLVVDMKSKLIIHFDIDKRVSFEGKIKTKKQSEHLENAAKICKQLQNNHNKLRGSVIKDLRRSMKDVTGKDCGSTKIPIATNSYYESTCSLLVLFFADGYVDTTLEKNRIHKIPRQSKVFRTVKSYSYAGLPEKSNSRWTKMADNVEVTDKNKASARNSTK